MCLGPEIMAGLKMFGTIMSIVGTGMSIANTLTADTPQMPQTAPQVIVQAPEATPEPEYRFEMPAIPPMPQIVVPQMPSNLAQAVANAEDPEQKRRDLLRKSRQTGRARNQLTGGAGLVSGETKKKTLGA